MLAILLFFVLVIVVTTIGCLMIGGFVAIVHIATGGLKSPENTKTKLGSQSPLPPTLTVIKPPIVK